MRSTARDVLHTRRALTTQTLTRKARAAGDHSAPAPKRALLAYAMWPTSRRHTSMPTHAMQVLCVPGARPLLVPPQSLRPGEGLPPGCSHPTPPHPPPGRVLGRLPPPPPLPAAAKAFLRRAWPQLLPAAFRAFRACCPFQLAAAAAVPRGQPAPKQPGGRPPPKKTAHAQREEPRQAPSGETTTPADADAAACQRRRAAAAAALACLPRLPLCLAS